AALGAVPRGAAVPAHLWAAAVGGGGAHRPAAAGARRAAHLPRPCRGRRSGGMSDAWGRLTPLVYRLDPERAHGLSLFGLTSGLARLVVPPHPARPVPALRRRLWGLDFAHPLGLAAGYDKNAVAVDALFGYGFAFIEIGGVTPRPQPGN